MVMTIGDCGDGRLCGRVAALGKLAATDAFNPIPANRSRPVCGLVLMTGLTGDNEGWRGSFHEGGYKRGGAPKAGQDMAAMKTMVHKHEKHDHKGEQYAARGHGSALREVDVG